MSRDGRDLFASGKAHAELALETAKRHYFLSSRVLGGGGGALIQRIGGLKNNTSLGGATCSKSLPTGQRHKNSSKGQTLYGIIVTSDYNLTFAHQLRTVI